MNDQWTDDIRKRMEQRRTAPPKGLLDDVKREMAARGLKPLAPVAQPHTRLFHNKYYRAAAAIALLAAMTATLTLLNEKQSDAPMAALDAGKDVRPSATTPATPAQPSTATPVLLADAGPTIRTTSGKSMIAMAHTPPIEGPVSATDAQPEAPTVDKGSTTDAATTNDRPTKPIRNTGRDTYEGGIALPTDHPKASARQNKISMATYYNSMGGKTTSNDMLLLATANPIGDYSEDMAGTNSRGVVKQKSEEGKRTRHGLPVKVGVGLNYYLSKRWSLQTGLNYSHLAAETTYGPTMKDEREKQSLHYIGVPVGVSYSLVRGKRFNIYASAGAEVEKLVSGKITIHDKAADTKAPMPSRSLSEHRPQFSVNGSIGAEYLFGNNLSAYVEPGVRHYFNNGSSIDNIYKDRPTNISLGVGLRLHINQ